MKNKIGIIALIVFLATLAILLVLVLIFFLSGNKKMPKNISLFETESTELIENKKINKTLSEIIINANASNIDIKKTSDEEIKIMIYGQKEQTTIEETEQNLQIDSTEKTCTGFCWKRKLTKIEISLPESYKGNVKITNNYGNIKIDELPLINLDIESDFGNIEIKAANKIQAKNSYGDLEIEKVVDADISSSAGNIEIDTVTILKATNNYGDIKLNEVNKQLEIENDCGDIKINKLFITEDSKIKNNLGTIKINQTNEINIDAETDLGKTKINNNYSNSSVKLKISNDCGDIKVLN